MRTFSSLIQTVLISVHLLWGVPLEANLRHECGVYEVVGYLRVDAANRKKSFTINPGAKNRVQIDLKDIKDPKFRNRHDIALFGVADIEITSRCTFNCLGTLIRWIKLQNPVDDTDYVSKGLKKISKVKCSSVAPAEKQ